MAVDPFFVPVCGYRRLEREDGKGGVLECGARKDDLVARAIAAASYWHLEVARRILESMFDFPEEQNEAMEQSKVKPLSSRPRLVLTLGSQLRETLLCRGAALPSGRVIASPIVPMPVAASARQAAKCEASPSGHCARAIVPALVSTTSTSLMADRALARSEGLLEDMAKLLQVAVPSASGASSASRTTTAASTPRLAARALDRSEVLLSEVCSSMGVASEARGSCV